MGAYLTGVHPVTAVIADLDGDGDDDVAVPGLVTPELVVLENDAGEIRWHPPVALPDGVTEMAAIDVDGDGRVELAATHREIEAVSIYRVTGDTEFEMIQSIAMDGLVTALAAADLDSDGDQDLAVSRFRKDTVELLVNEGGRLEAGASIPTGGGPFAIRLADLDGDQVSEMAVAGAGSDRVEVFAGGGLEWQRAWTAATDAWPSWLEIVDVDGDGASELLGTATIGDRVFAIDAAGSYRTLGAGDGAFAVSAGDSDGDGALELAVSNKDAGTVALLDPAAGTAIEIDVGALAGPSPIYRWDLDADGRAELLVVVCAFIDQVSILGWR